MNIQPRPLKDGKPAWRCEFTAGHDPATGDLRRIRETFRGTKREAERFWAKRQAEIDAAGAGFVKGAKDTLADYLARWLLDYGAPNLKPTTLASYRTLADRHVIPALGAVPLSDLTAQAVSAWQADMLRKPGRGGRALSLKRVANARMMLHTALQEAVRLGVISSNPVARVRPPKQTPKKVEGFTLVQVEALTATAEGHRLEALFATAWQTGMRMGELLGLRWTDVDFDAGTVRVEATAASTGGPVFIQTPKTEAGTRTLALPPPTMAAIRAHRARQAQERLKAGKAWQDRGLVFPTSKGTPIMPTSLEKTWYAVRDRAGLPPFGFHSLRHTYASLALSSGVALEMVSENLGHKNPGFTKRVYAAYLLDAKRAAADTMAALIGRVRHGQ